MSNSGVRKGLAFWEYIAFWTLKKLSNLNFHIQCIEHRNKSCFICLFTRKDAAEVFAREAVADEQQDEQRS